jgi:signal transduction histidine kinase/ligand-binding sensor domain-containing protein
MIVRAQLQPAICLGQNVRRESWRMRGLGLVGLLAVVLAGMTFNAAGQATTTASLSAQSTEFAIEIWRTDDDLPQNTVTAVLQTRRSYIWAGTYNGVVQFDGLRFTVFNSSTTTGLANSRVTSLYEDSNGDIWIGHDTGEVTRHVEGKFLPVPLMAGWGNAPIKDFVTDEFGELWVLNQLGEALRFKDQIIHRPSGLMRENPFVNPRVTLDSQKRAYVVRNGVVARFSSRGYEIVDFSDPSVRPYYPGMAAARDGNLWVVGEGKVRKWNGTNWVADLGSAPWGSASVTTLLETSSGRLLVGTLQSGLFVLDPVTGWFFLNRTNGLPQDWVCSLAEDREKNLWVGTGGGLAVLRERKVMMYSPPDQWEGRPVYAITRTHDGRVWAATEGAGLYQFAGGNWTRFGAEQGLANQFVWSVFEDSQKQIWAGTWGGGLFRLEHGRFVCQSNLIPISDPVVALKESPAGTMWVGTGAGLVRVRSNSVARLAPLGGAAAGDVRAIEVGPRGEIWCGTQGAGLGLWYNGVFKTFQTEDGLPGNYILSLLCEADGTVWIGTLDTGLSRYRNGEFRNLTMAQGLPGNIIYHIEADEMGNFWFNSPTGLFRITRQELNDCADGKLATMQALAFGKAEGMSTLAGTGGFTPSGFRAPDGQLWFSTARGIAVVAPKSARLNQVRPPVWIEEVLVGDKPVPISHTSPTGINHRSGRNYDAQSARSRVVLQPGRQQMDVLFTGLSFTSPERVQFKYRLEGLDATWTEGGTRRRVTYPYLPPGEYTFRVIACNSDGLWNETGDTLAIVMLPYFWQTWWFKTVMTFIGVGLLALVFFLESRRRLHRKLERIARERELERERSRIAQDIHDDLGASLTRIGMLSQSVAGDLHDPPRATANLNQIYDTARDLTRAMDEIVWAVNPRHDTLESLTNYVTRFAHDFLRTAHIRCRLDAPVHLPDLTVRSEVRHNLFLAFKETLNNAVKHSGASEVRVNFELQPGGLQLVVADNGSGFNPDKKTALPAGDRVVSGYGMASIRARLEQVGGRVAIISQIGQGTRVELFVPLLPGAGKAAT